ncbi:alpha-mannosyltransferase [Colletotrichum tofieldiae]|nr:alpha-mannosyltransferase [Colletotrichum tofieldiae]GKT87597.1 alpha-mannosyltransferase [Colletotrichum tofieldiae]
MIQEMLDDDTLRLYAVCNVSELPSVRLSGKKFDQASCNLNITVYGPAEEFEEIGKWFQEYNVYLQDPLMCHVDARYCNPHKLASNDVGTCPMLSDVVFQGSEQITFQDITEPMDMLDMLNSRCDLKEAKQPAVITAELKR